VSMVVQNQIKILIVDDSPRDVNLIKIHLKDLIHNSYHTYVSHSLADSENLLNQNQIDIVLLDIDLLDSKGMETIDKMLDLADNTPIVIFTINGEDDLGLKAIKKGIQDYLFKDRFDSQLLTHSIEYSIARKKLEHELNPSKKVLEIIQQEHESKVEQAPNELQSDPEIFKLFAQTSPIGIVILNKQGDITFANRHAEIALELSKDDIIKRKYNAPEWKMTDYEGNDFPPEELPFNIVKVTLSPLLDVKHAIEHSNGKRIFLSINATPLLNESGGFNGMIATINNVTESVKAEKKLKASLKRYQELFNSIDSGVIVYKATDDGLNFIIKEFNSAAERIDNLNRENIIGKEVTEIFPGIKDFGLFSVFQKVWKTGVPEHQSSSYYQDNRIAGWRQNYVYKLTSGDIVAIYNDLTQNKETEQKLLEFDFLLNERLKELNCLYEISQVAEKPGITIEQILYEFVNLIPLAWQFPKKTYSRIEYNGKSYQSANYNKTKLIVTIKEIIIDKPLIITIYSSSQKTPFLEEEKQLTKEIGIRLKSIIQRKLAEEELRNSKEKYKILYEEAPIAYFSIDLDGTIQKCNNAAEKLLGYSKEELLKMTAFDLYFNSEDGLVKAKKIFKEFTKGYSIIDEELQMKHKNQNPIWISLTVKPVLDKTNKVIASRSMVMDISERVKAKEEIEDLAKFPSEDPNPVLRTTSEFIIYANQAGCDMFDCRIGYRIPYNLRESIKNAYLEKKPQKKELKIKDRFYSMSFFPIQNTNYVNVYGHDITDLKLTQRKLKDERAKVEQYLELAGVIMRALDNNGDIVLLNKKGCEILGYESGELLGKNWFETCLPDYEKERILKVFEDSMITKNEGYYYVENYVTTKTGEELLIKWRNIVVFDENKKIIGTLSSGENITENKKALVKLELSEEKYKNLIESSAMGLIKIDLQSNEIVYINPKLIEILGYDVYELKDANSFYEIIHPEDRYLFSKSFETKEMEFRIFSKVGKLKYLSGSLLPQYNINGDVLSYKIWVQDITQQKEILMIKNNLLTRFSHEFKTPLISLIGFTDFFLMEYKDLLDTRAISFLNNIKNGSEKLKRLVNSFIESSQLETDLVNLNLSHGNIIEVVKKSLNDLQGLIQLRKHTVHLDLNENVLFYFDKEKIYVVIMNLLVNAINYTPNGGLISIKSIVMDKSIEICIKDNGIGFTEEEKENLFKPFGKVERYGKGWDVVSEGMGMGLFISKEIIKLHGGTIKIESEGRNKGSKFIFSVPIKI